MWSAPGNIFFSGEHAVVYGRPAIVASVGLRTRVEIKPKEDKLVVINSREFGTAKAELDGSKKDGEAALIPVLELVLDLIKDTKNGLEIHIESDIPVESGMSSSTAVSSAILGALNEFLGLGIKKEDYFDILHAFQVKVHGGKASGSEIFSSVFGGFNYLEKKNINGKERLTAVQLGDLPISVVIGDTKIKAPTKLTVGYHVPSMMDRYPSLVEYIFDSIADVTEKARKAIERKDIEKLGSLMDENQSLLDELGLSHPKLDDCIRTARRAGALGAKLSGGGWGGIMFAITYPDRLDAVADAIAKTGAKVIKTSIGVEGLRKE